MKSGMMAAETAYNALHPDKEIEIEKNSLDQPLEGSAREAVDMSPYETAFKESWVYKELNEVRNLRPSFHNPLGLWGGMAYSGLDSMFLKGRTPWTLRNTWEDHAATKKASECQPIDYPAPDGKLSFDILTSVSLTGTNHAEDQPVHLRLPKDEGARARHVETNVDGTSDLPYRICVLSSPDSSPPHFNRICGSSRSRMPSCRVRVSGCRGRCCRRQREEIRDQLAELYSRECESIISALQSRVLMPRDSVFTAQDVFHQDADAGYHLVCARRRRRSQVQ